MFVTRLKQARSAAGITQKEIATKLFLTQQAYARYETGLSTPNPETLRKIASVLDISIDYLLGNDNPPSAKTGKKIPVLGHVAAGIPISAIENILDYEEITPELAITGDFFALSIKGDSMEPRIKDGDVVIVRQQEDVDSGDIAIVCVNGDEATCKKVMKHENGISLVPLNTKYEPMFYTAEEANTKPVRIIGKVVELRGKF